MQKLTCSRFAGIAAAICLLFLAENLLAQATLSIQGIIRKSNGAAVDDGKYDLTFKLYPAPSGGTAVHNETQNISVVGGIYSAELGGGNDPLNAAFDQTYYLGVSVDGGPELVPRVRLTSSPYALSLLGTSNLFSGAGGVGIGTVSPASGFGLHLKNGAGVGKQLVEGSDGAFLNFNRTGYATASIGIGNANNDLILNGGGSYISLQHNGSTKLQVNNNGVTVNGTLDAGTVTTGTLNATNFPANVAIPSKLAVGQSAVDAYTFKVNGGLSYLGTTQIAGNGLQVTGSTTGSLGIHTYYGIAGSGPVNGNANISISAAQDVVAAGFHAVSDRRIKKDFRLSDHTNDLATLQKLRVTDYRHVDVVQNGAAFKKGFIAQEVEEVFPEAVGKSENFIPDVYALSTSTQLVAGKMLISLEKNHGFAVGDEVKLMLPDGEKKVVVAAVPAENAFVLDWTEAAQDKIFVYGKKVKDFHTVDYDRIFTLNVSATQELARQVLELQQVNQRKDKQIEEMKASAEKFDARLRALENRISN